MEFEVDKQSQSPSNVTHGVGPNNYSKLQFVQQANNIKNKVKQLLGKLD